MKDPEWKRAFNKCMEAERLATNPPRDKLPPMALSTVDLDGRPAVRMVSTRGFVGDGYLHISAKESESAVSKHWSSDILTLCTHAKSNKVREMLNTKGVQMVWFLPATNIQIRLSADAHLLFHPDNPNYSTLSLNLRHRLYSLHEEREGKVPEVDCEFIREQAYLHHSPAVQAWYVWPPPGRPRQADTALFPERLETEEHIQTARLNHVLVFLDVFHVDIVDLNGPSRKIYSRRDGDLTWYSSDVNP